MKTNFLHILTSHVAATACSGAHSSSFLSFPTWYEYLPNNSATGCSPSLQSLGDVWLIVAAVIEILLRVAALMAVGFVIYGGIEYMTSQGSPEQTSRAGKTLMSAGIGLLICIMASVIIAFIAESLTK